MNILVSACLLGTPCRYDGKSKPCEAVQKLSKKVHFIPVCPEEAGGLTTPRSPAEQKSGRVINAMGKDVTEAYEKGAKKAHLLAKENGCRFAILKERSPSCGNREIYDGTFTGTLQEGMGVTARLLKENGIEVFGESEIELLKQKTGC